MHYTEHMFTLEMNILEVLDIRNQTSAVSSPIDCCGYSVPRVAYANHSSHLSSFVFCASIVQPLDVALPPPHMHHSISFPIAFSSQPIAQDHVRVGSANVSW